MTRYPIAFYAADGEPTFDHVRGWPCVDIDIRASLELDAVGPVVRVRALVDTGADMTYATPELLASIDAVAFGSVDTVNGGGAAKLWGIYLQVTPSDAIPVVTIDRDFLSEGAIPYQFVLGRFALQHFSITMNLARLGASYLDLVPESPTTLAIKNILSS